MTNCKSFSPKITTKSKILILGSMPGVKSLEEQQYYAHPQNRFWKLMGLFCKCANMNDLNYSNKINILLDNGFALWDVIKFCSREGSLDSNIQDEIPNEIPELLKNYPNIEKICLNGNTAYTTFTKYYPQLLQEYKCYNMPSTSPANAKYTLNKLYDKWSDALK